MKVEVLKVPKIELTLDDIGLKLAHIEKHEYDKDIKDYSFNFIALYNNNVYVYNIVVDEYKGKLDKEPLVNLMRVNYLDGRILEEDDIKSLEQDNELDSDLKHMYQDVFFMLETFMQDICKNYFNYFKE